MPAIFRPRGAGSDAPARGDRHVCSKPTLRISSQPSRDGFVEDRHEHPLIPTPPQTTGFSPSSKRDGKSFAATRPLLWERSWRMHAGHGPFGVKLTISSAPARPAGHFPAPWGCRCARPPQCTAHPARDFSSSRVGQKQPLDAGCQRGPSLLGSSSKTLPAKLNLSTVSAKTT